MKFSIIISVFAVSTLFLSSCTQQVDVDSKPDGAITSTPTRKATIPSTQSPTFDEITQNTPLAEVNFHNTEMLKNLLVSLGYLEIGITDGVFDSQTESAIKHFQLLNGLYITGEVDDSLWEALEGNPSPYYLPRPFPGYVYPVDGSVPMCDDHALQEGLADLGFLEPGSDEWSIGAFGTETQKALKEFQKAYLPTQSGKPDFETWQALFSPLLSLTDQETTNQSATWSTSNYAVDSGVIAMDWDGSHLWLAVNKGISVYDNYLIRIDPNAHPADAVQVIRVRDCNALDASIANMVYAAGKIWLLYNYDVNGNPEPMVQTVDVTTGVARSPFKFASCPDGYCVPAYAMGTSKSTVWVTANDRAYGLDPSTGSVQTSRPVGYMASGRMVFDGQCFWYLGEASVQPFNPAGGPCRGDQAVNALSYDYPQTDGKQVWTIAYDGTLSQLNLATGESILTEPVGIDPVAMAYSNGILWIADRTENTVVGMSTLDGSLGEPIPLDGSDPAFILQESNYLWIYYQGTNTVERLDVTGYTILPVERTATPTQTVTPSPTPPALQRTLKLENPNLEGDDVLMLQEQLLILGYNEVGVADGVFGPLTDKAIRRYQEDHGLVVDGIVGPITWGLLFQ